MTRTLLVCCANVILAACGWEKGQSHPGRVQADLPPVGAHPLGAAAERAAIAGVDVKGSRAVLERGAERYAIFCTPCHGPDGSGDGPVVRRGFPSPPSLHDERLRTMPPAYVVNVITHGTGAMYPLAERIPPSDRWAIALYVQETQRRGKVGPP